MKIICINGFARSGKDSFCDAVFKNRGLTYSFSTVDKIKEIALELGWDGQKDAKGRKLLSDIKDALTEYNDFPTQDIINKIKQKLTIYKGPDEDALIKDVIFFVHMREPEEIRKWKDRYGARALYIARPLTEIEWGNHADDNVLEADYDYVLINNSTLEDWEEKAVEFVDKIRKEEWESNIWK